MLSNLNYVVPSFTLASHQKVCFCPRAIDKANVDLSRYATKYEYFYCFHIYFLTFKEYNFDVNM